MNSAYLKEAGGFEMTPIQFGELVAVLKSAPESVARDIMLAWADERARDKGFNSADHMCEELNLKRPTPRPAKPLLGCNVVRFNDYRFD